MGDGLLEADIVDKLDGSRLEEEDAAEDDAKSGHDGLKHAN